MMGLSQKVPSEIAEMGEEKLDKYAYIMESMTAKEKRDPELMNKSRIARIAKGSGTTQQEVRELLKNFKKMKRAFKEFSDLDAKKLEQGKGMDMQKLQKIFGKKKKMKLR